MPDKPYKKGLFIFRRDLRVVDNNGLNYANSVCESVVPVFIFTPEQIDKNPYKSNNAILFMLECLEDLSSEINSMGGHLLFFYGKNETVIPRIVKHLGIDFVCFNGDYTPYAVARDTRILGWCQKNDIDAEVRDDYCLNEPYTIKPYQKFTPYYATAVKKRVAQPVPKRAVHFASQRVPSAVNIAQIRRRFTVSEPDGGRLSHGGRQSGLKQMTVASRIMRSYARTRDDLSSHTSELSPHIKFGTVSIREVYDRFKDNDTFKRQLYWRDFYAQIVFHFSHVIGHALKDNYNRINWHFNANWFKRWCNGTTGFPAVDAGMRQLNATGYMHNRCRMIVSSFLTKILLIDWRRGEKYFAQKLTDYDPANNNGGWQWSAGTGADAQPYFRIFNPFLQSKEHDKDCEYIKMWIPELKDVPPEAIHKWGETFSEYETEYPEPMVNYAEQKEKALKMYSRIF